MNPDKRIIYSSPPQTQHEILENSHVRLRSYEQILRPIVRFLLDVGSAAFNQRMELKHSTIL